MSDLDILEDLEDEPPFDTRWVFEIFVNEEVEVDFVDVDFEELPLKRPWPPTMIPFPPRSICGINCCWFVAESKSRRICNIVCGSRRGFPW